MSVRLGVISFNKCEALLYTEMSSSYTPEKPSVRLTHELLGFVYMDWGRR